MNITPSFILSYPFVYPLRQYCPIFDVTLSTKKSQLVIRWCSKHQSDPDIPYFVQNDFVRFYNQNCEELPFYMVGIGRFWSHIPVSVSILVINVKKQCVQEA